MPTPQPRKRKICSMRSNNRRGRSTMGFHNRSCTALDPRVSLVESCRTMSRFIPWMVLLAAMPIRAFAADPIGYPPPGLYRIDSETVTAFGAGGQGMRMTTRTDGATGTVTSIATTPGQPPATNVVRGGKPVTWCVRSATAADAPRNSPFACKTTGAQASSTASSFSAACQSVAMENTFAQVDPTTWEHAMAFEIGNELDPLASVRAAVARAAPSMSPAERAQAEKDLAGLPSQAEMDKEQAQARAELEDIIRTGTPDEAASARQALQSLQRGRAGPALQTIHVKERWTRIAASCSS